MVNKREKERKMTKRKQPDEDKAPQSTQKKSKATKPLAPPKPRPAYKGTPAFGKSKPTIVPDKCSYEAEPGVSATTSVAGMDADQPTGSTGDQERDAANMLLELANQTDGEMQTMVQDNTLSNEEQSQAGSESMDEHGERSGSDSRDDSASDEESDRDDIGASQLQY